MTLYEYDLRMRASRLKEVDREHEIYLQAWADYMVQATKKQGKDRIVPVYKMFNQFYDYDKRISEVLDTGKKHAQEERLKYIARRVQEYEGREPDYGKL